MIAEFGPVAEMSKEDQRATNGVPRDSTKPPPVVCRDYLTAVHPVTGLDVVFVPGEALPEWAAEVQTRKNAPAPIKPPAGKAAGLKKQPAPETEPHDLA